MKFAFKITLITLIVSILGLALIEFVLRYIHPTTPVSERYIRLRENYPSSERKLLFDCPIPEDHPHPMSHSSIIRIDGNGFVKPSKIHLSPDRTIVFLGGSTTRCTFVDEKMRFPYLVGRYLEKSLDLKINSINSGVSGNSTIHSVDILINKVIPLKPDIAILHHNINDLITLLILDTYWNDHFRRSLIVDPKPYSIYGIMKHVRYNILRATFDFIFHHPILEKAITQFNYRGFEEFKEYRGKKVSVDRKHILGEFERVLEMFIRICKVYEIKPMLLTQANRISKNPDPDVQEYMEPLELDYGVSYDEFSKLYKDMNDVVRTVASKHDIGIVDLDHHLSHKFENVYDLVHYSNQGSMRAAELITHYIEGQDLL